MTFYYIACGKYGFTTTSAVHINGKPQDFRPYLQNFFTDKTKAQFFLQAFGDTIVRQFNIFSNNKITLRDLAVKSFKA